MSNENQSFKDRFTEVGAIWKSDKALSFKLKDEAKLGDKPNIVAFPNQFKKKDDEPDYRLFIDTQPKTK